MFRQSASAIIRAILTQKNFCSPDDGRSTLPNMLASETCWHVNVFIKKLYQRIIESLHFFSGIQVFRTFLQTLLLAVDYMGCSTLQLA